VRGPENQSPLVPWSVAGAAGCRCWLHRDLLALACWQGCWHGVRRNRVGGGWRGSKNCGGGFFAFFQWRTEKGIHDHVSMAGSVTEIGSKFRQEGEVSLLKGRTTAALRRSSLK
jgi:hypothetical protein